MPTNEFTAPVEPTIPSSVKLYTTYAVGLCSAYTVNQMIKNNTNATGKLSKLALTVGTFAIGGAVVKATEPYIDDVFDRVAETFATLKSAAAPEAIVITDKE
jgi:hypothetical protein